VENTIPDALCLPPSSLLIDIIKLYLTASSQQQHLVNFKKLILNQFILLGHYIEIFETKNADIKGLVIFNLVKNARKKEIRNL